MKIAILSVLLLTASPAFAQDKLCIDASSREQYNARPISQHEVLAKNAFGADHRHQGGDDEAMGFKLKIAAQRPKHEAARQRAHQAQCDIDQTAGALLAHDQAGQPADEGAEHDPAENLHVSFLTMGGLDPPIQAQFRV